MEDKTHEEIEIEVQRITLLKNSVISVQNYSALTTYKPAQHGTKCARNVQNGDILQQSDDQIT